MLCLEREGYKHTLQKTEFTVFAKQEKKVFGWLRQHEKKVKIFTI